MEKFSAFRDPGTGIQPFLTPVPAGGSDILATILKLFGYILGIIRTSLVLALAFLYLALVDGASYILTLIPPLHRSVKHVITALLARLALLLVGLPWIQVELVTRKRVKPKGHEKWKPKAGDLIVSNWVSWIEILWLAFRLDPIFVLPVCSPVDLTSTARASAPLSVTPGRRTGTGSAAISGPRTSTPRAKVLGFRRVSLFSIITSTGYVPEEYGESAEFSTLEAIRMRADRPVVVFPECTTSNGRGLLRFADVFIGIDVPVRKFKVFVMCVRYDPPTPLCPTLSRSIPSATLNPLSHIFTLTTSFIPATVSIRLLAPSESPSSGSFLESEFSAGGIQDVVSESCAALIAQIGKMKRIGMGWEDKAAFLEFYRGKKK